MSAKIAVISSITWLIGWSRPAVTAGSRAGSDTSIVSAASRATRASAASASRRATSALDTRSFRRFNSAPRALRSSGAMRPSDAIRAETEPFLPSTATRTDSSAPLVTGGGDLAQDGPFEFGVVEHLVTHLGRVGSADISRGAVFSVSRQAAAAGSAPLAFSTMALKASGSVMASSDRTLRSSSMPALLSPSMKRE